MGCFGAQPSLISACMFQRTYVVTTCQLADISTDAAVVACCIDRPSGKLLLSLSTWSSMWECRLPLCTYGILVMTPDNMVEVKRAAKEKERRHTLILRRRCSAATAAFHNQLGTG
jgi:hypothetical protein